MAEASLQPIYERLNAADGYHPFSANTFTDWAIEAGDIVTISRETESYTSPVHSSHLSWRGSPVMTLQSRGKKELDSIGKATQKKFARSGGAYRASRNVAKKSSVYFQKQNPLVTPGIEVHKDDIWIESDMLNTWDDICELTWDEIGEYTWLDFYGCKMYAYDGFKWVEITDEQKSNYNFDLFRNTQTELQSIKGDLSGAISEIYQSKEQIYHSINDTKSGLESRIDQTAGQIRSEVTDTKNGLQSSITQTASQIRSEVSDSVNGLQSSITQTATEIRSEVSDSVSGLQSSISQTATQIRSEVSDSVSGLQSSISQTATQIRSEVSDSVSGLQSSITQNANRIALVVDGNGIKPAAIVTAINAQTGQSAVKISADIIELDGDAIADALIGTSISVIDVVTDLISVSDTLDFASDSGIRCGSTLYNAADVVINASVSGNVLTLYKLGSSTPITFSKATTLDSSWSGSVLTLSAKQNNTSVATRQIGIGGSFGDHDIDLIVDQNGSIAHSSGATAIIPIKVAQLQGGGATTNRYTKSLLVDMSSLLTTGSYNTSGTKTPGSSYIGFSSVTFTIPNASGFARSSTYNTQNSNLVGSISKSGLSGNEYLYWTVGGKKYHIVVNT